MQKRDTGILVVAVICGVLAFYLVMNILKKPATARVVLSPASESPSKHVAGPLPIPSGMSALTMSSKEMESVPDLAEVGSFVDILGDVSNYEGKMELQTIVRGAQIINIDKKEGVGVDSITAAVSPVAAEVVSKAMNQGKLRLILRADGGGKGASEVGEVVVTEVIRGVEKDKSAHIEK